MTIFIHPPSTPAELLAWALRATEHQARRLEESREKVAKVERARWAREKTEREAR